MMEKDRQKNRKKELDADQLPSRTQDLVDELNFWETSYGRGISIPEYKVPGEARAKIDSLKAELARLNVPITWMEGQYALNQDEFQRTVESIKDDGPLVMTDEERKKSCCNIESFETEGDSYDDTGGKSRKKIKFKFKVKKGADPKKCVLVNWMKGFFKNGDGNFFKSTHQGKADTPNNYPKWRVDTVDEDPVYWSTPSSRWNYDSEGDDTYSATDDPGPALSSEHGAEYAKKYRMCIYCIDDVPKKKTDGVIKSKAIKCIDWQYSVKVANDGSFTHPQL